MNGYKKVNVGDIALSKLKKALKTGKLSLSKDDVMGDIKTMILHPLNAKLIEKAKKLKKGVTGLNISGGEIQADLQYHSESGAGMTGGSVWSWLKKAGKDVYGFTKDNWQIIKPIASAIADKAIPAAFTAIGQPAFGALGRKAFKELSGVGIKEQRCLNLAKAREAKKTKKLTGSSFLIN